MTTERKKGALFGKVRLIFRNHPAGKGEMKSPGDTDRSVENTPVRLHVYKQAEQAIQRDGEQAVERKKVGRERDPEIVFVGDDVPAFATNAKTADPSAHEIDPERMRKFMTKNVEQHRPRQTEKSDQPQDRA